MSPAALAVALALTQANAVTIRCAEPCTAKLDGKSGTAVDDHSTRISGVAAGSRRLEAVGKKSGPLFVGFVEVPAGDSIITLDAQGRPAVAVAVPPMPPPPGAPAPTSGILAAADWPSTVRVHCARRCAVTIEGRPATRVTESDWSMEGVLPGPRRIEARGPLGADLGSGVLTIPAGSEVDVGARGGNLTLGVVRSLAAQPAAPASAATAGNSVLHLHCQKPCAVRLDGQRRGSDSLSDSPPPVTGVTPGSHGIEVKFLFGQARGQIDVPAGSDVHVFAQDGAVRVTRSTPLAP